MSKNESNKGLGSVTHPRLHVASFENDRSAELKIISEIAQGLNGSVDIREALQTTLAHVAQLLGLETGWIWLLNEETGSSYLAASQNLPPALAQNPRRMEGSCYCLDIYHDGEMAGAANISVVSCSRLKNLVEDTNGLTYHASIPLYAHGKELGLLNVASNDWKELSADELQLLHTVGDMLGIAIERARLFEDSLEMGAVNERNRLAREIHDTLAQGLAAIVLQLETADALLETSPEREKLSPLITKAVTTAQENLEEARRSVMGLRATPLDGCTLAEALRRTVRSLPSDGPSVDFSIIGEDAPLPTAIEAGLLRVAQEALNNVQAHAQADSVEMWLSVTPEQAELEIRDNGIGFDVQTMPQNRFGLLGMNERVKLLEGTLHIESTPGQGTHIRAQIPLHNAHLRDVSS
ncbi:MAG: GAF domain-containing sensor histidine kinase [Chloroflexota bacterium]